MPLMSFMDEAGIAQHTRLIFLAILADPHNIILLEGMLANPMRGHITNPLHLWW